MKGKLYFGIILISVALFSTFVMNMAGIFKGAPYVYYSHKDNFGTAQYTFYDNTYKTGSHNGFYSRNGTEIKFDNNEGGKGEIGTYVLMIYDDIYINKTAIGVQLAFLTMLVWGIIEVLNFRLKTRNKIGQQK